MSSLTLAEVQHLLEQRNAELAVINSVQEGLVAEMDMQGLYDLVGDRIRELFDAQVTGIVTLDLEDKTEHFQYAYEEGERIFPSSRQYDKIREKIIRDRQPLLIAENAAQIMSEINGKPFKPVPGTRMAQTALYVPMIVGEVVKGYVTIQNNDREHAFTESNIKLLGTLTNSLSIALENARLFNETTRLLAETKQRAAEMQTVNNISRALVSQLEFDSLVRLVGEQMRDTFKADIVYLAIHDRDSNMLHFPYYYGDPAESRPFGNGITERIIIDQEPLLINQDLERAYDKIKAKKMGRMVQSYLGVPIISDNRSIGVISVQSTEEENRFTENDLRLLSTIAANVGVAMQNAEAYRKLQSTLSNLKLTQEQLIQSEKMASLGELTAGIAHEIQNPLNFVNNFSEINSELIDELKIERSKLKVEKSSVNNEGDEDLIDELLNDIQENEQKITYHGKRADAIVKGMLHHSRSSSGQKELTDLNTLCDEYLRLAYHGLRAKDKSFNAALKTDFDKSLPKVKVIPQDMGRVILNLITNAFYAVTQKKNEGIAAYEPTVTIGTMLKGESIEIHVSDNGNGIPTKVLDKIFQPFFTTKPTGQGTGLGLSMSYDIITKGHGGMLKVETKEREGTTFAIILPVKGR